jgi:RNA-directed DNA polymerase
LLANLFLHYAFDRWMAREFPDVPFERYADDGVAHCASEAQAREVLADIARRLAEVGLELHPDKTRIVYCKDADRRGSYEHERFDFLGYTFRPRLSKSRHGKHFVNFSPAVSDVAKREIGREIRSWHLARRSDKTLTDLARIINPIVQGWINFYGRFYKSMLFLVLRRINERLARWAMRKYKRLRGHITRAVNWLAGVARREPRRFAHWRVGVRPDGWTVGAR